MQKILLGFLVVLAIGGIVFFKRYYHHIAFDPRADDDHAVHIAMGGHDFVIPRYYLVASPGDNVTLKNTITPAPHGHGNPVTHIASFDLVASLPKFDHVASTMRDAPYGNSPNDKIRFIIANQPAPVPVTLQDYALDLQNQNVNYTSEEGPYGLAQEEETPANSKVPASVHHYFGGLYGRQLMITCNDAPGLSCSFTYPLDQTTVTVEFSKAILSQWAVLYPAAVNFVTRFRKD